MSGPSKAARPSRQEVHREIDQLLDLIDQMFDSEQDPTMKGGAAVTLAIEAGRVAAWALGEEVISEAYGSVTEENDVAEQLNALAVRLLVGGQIFAGIDRREDPYSIRSAIVEIRAVAGGDAPRIFENRRSTKGMPANAYRLALLEMTALEWNERLKADGRSASERQAMITSAYGATWDAIKKWKSKATAVVGSDRVSARLVQARSPNFLSGLQMQRGVAQISDDEALKYDGKLYQEEKRRSK